MSSISRIIAYIVTFFFLWGCASMPEVRNNRDTGWISDDAFRVRAAGTAKYETADLHARKQQALQSAVLMARVIVYEELSAVIADDVKRLSRKEIIRRLKNEFDGYVKDGRAVDVNCDDEGICAIIFEIRGERIKQKFFALRNRLMMEKR